MMGSDQRLVVPSRRVPGCHPAPNSGLAVKRFQLRRNRLGSRRGSDEWTLSILGTVAAGTVASGDVPAAHGERLRKHRIAAIQGRTGALLPVARSADRAAIVAKYGVTPTLTGDATAEDEPDLMQALTEPIDVLKVAHHGSAYSSTMPFLEKARPRYAVISCGTDNDYGHPALSTLERLRVIEAEIYRTDLQGDIRLISNGGEPVLSAFSL